MRGRLPVFVALLLAIGGAIAVSGPTARAQGRGGAAAPAAAADVRVLQIRPNLYLISGAGANITAFTFDEGVMVVDTGTAAMADKVLAAIKQLTDSKIAHIINTSDTADHVGGNEKFASVGIRIPLEVVVGEGPMIMAHENAHARMSAPTGKQAALPERAWPNETYRREYRKLVPRYRGGEEVELLHEPAAHTDGDTMVWFRRADVLVTGDIYTTTSYPIIEVANGGTIDGEIDAVNKILEVAFPGYGTEGGTIIVPGHGRLSDTADVGFYRDMLTVIRGRVQDLIKKGQTLEQVKAAKPTRDYDPRFGATTGAWTTDMFVEAVYKSLSAKK